ncbi:CPBP family intramembrane glutamic endopeptidase [Corynebacterium aquilae]|uniref:CPBP family intramembrane glutamic endopeptidase n=1 Tax=Corynebacterium aquilae TaxID=203263 RepID=UPI000952289E|nr:CPBP family intramembrane glutamic endopeptidase [Corynebacterium aquilae]
MIPADHTPHPPASITNPALDLRHTPGSSSVSAPATLPTKALAVFFLVSFSMAWVVCLPLWLTDLKHNMLAVGALAGVMMFTPALGVVAAMLITHTPAAGERLAYLGMGVPKRWGAFLGYVALAIFGPFAIIVAIVAESILFGFITPDIVHLSGYMQQSGLEASSLHPWLLVGIQLLFFPVGALLNSLLAFGEEIGWRGWLITALRPLGVVPSVLLVGAAWGLWHTPLILLGYNYQRSDIIGPAMMTVACMAWGMILGWMRYASGSVYIPAVAHGAINGAAGLTLMFHAAGTTQEQLLSGPLGLVAVLVCLEVVAVGYAIRALRSTKSRA